MNNKILALILLVACITTNVSAEYKVCRYKPLDPIWPAHVFDEFTTQDERTDKTSQPTTPCMLSLAKHAYGFIIYRFIDETFHGRSTRYHTDAHGIFIHKLTKNESGGFTEEEIDTPNTILVDTSDQESIKRAAIFLIQHRINEPSFSCTDLTAFINELYQGIRWSFIYNRDGSNLNDIKFCKGNSPADTVRRYAEKHLDHTEDAMGGGGEASSGGDAGSGAAVPSSATLPDTDHRRK